jgi:hypothetical protein
MTPFHSIQEGGCTTPRWPTRKAVARVLRTGHVSIRSAVFMTAAVVMGGASYVGFILGASVGVEFSHWLTGTEASGALVIGSVLGGSLGLLLPALVAIRIDRSLRDRTRGRDSSE